MPTTPLESLHKQLDAEIGDYADWQLPKFYTSADQELSGMNESCAAFDLSSFGRIMIKGAQAEKLVEVLLATDTSSLIAGKCIRGFCCDEQGQIVDFIRVIASGNSYIVMTSPAGRTPVLELMEKCKIHFDISKVDIADQTQKTAMVAVYGPRAVEALNNIVPLDIDDIEPESVENFNFFMMNITVVRSSWLDTEGMELICPAGAAKFAGGAIEKYHKKEGIVPAGMESLRVALLEKQPFEGISELPQQKITPKDVGMTGLIDMTKDFYGKSALA